MPQAAEVVALLLGQLDLSPPEGGRPLSELLADAHLANLKAAEQEAEREAALLELQHLHTALKQKLPPRSRVLPGYDSEDFVPLGTARVPAGVITQHPRTNPLKKARGASPPSQTRGETVNERARTRPAVASQCGGGGSAPPEHHPARSAAGLCPTGDGLPLHRRGTLPTRHHTERALPGQPFWRAAGGPASKEPARAHRSASPAQAVTGWWGEDEDDLVELPCITRGMHLSARRANTQQEGARHGTRSPEQQVPARGVMAPAPAEAAASAEVAAPSQPPPAVALPPALVETKGRKQHRQQQRPQEESCKLEWRRGAQVLQRQEDPTAGAARFCSRHGSATGACVEAPEGPVGVPPAPSPAPGLGSAAAIPPPDLPLRPRAASLDLDPAVMAMKLVAQQRAAQEMCSAEGPTTRLPIVPPPLQHTAHAAMPPNAGLLRWARESQLLGDRRLPMPSSPQPPTDPAERAVIQRMQDKLIALKQARAAVQVGISDVVGEGPANTNEGQQRLRRSPGMLTQQWPTACMQRDLRLCSTIASGGEGPSLNAAISPLGPLGCEFFVARTPQLDASVATCLGGSIGDEPGSGTGTSPRTTACRAKLLDDAVGGYQRPSRWMQQSPRTRRLCEC